MADELKRAFGLEGERALITGGGTGLGFAMAKCFVQAGADVVITGRREDMLKEAVKQLGPKADYRVFDVTDTANAVPFVEMLTQEIGPVSILVNNAGRHCKKPVLDVTQEDLQNVLDVHLMGSFALTKAVVPGMLERKKGNILFISSMSAYLGMTQVTAYSAAKSAVLGLVKTLSGELADKGIRVNAIAPASSIRRCSARRLNRIFRVSRRSSAIRRWLLRRSDGYRLGGGVSDFPGGPLCDGRVPAGRRRLLHRFLNGLETGRMNPVYKDKKGGKNT